MKAAFRKLVLLAISILMLAALLGGAPRWLDLWILAVVWFAALLGSIVLLVRFIRRPSGSHGFSFGQLALLPRNWQRWVLGEPTRPKKDETGPDVGQ